MKKMLAVLTVLVVGCNAANVEDNVVRLVEEGKVAQAQAEAQKSGALGKDLVRLKGILFHAVGQSDSALFYLKQAREASGKDARITLRLAEVLFWKKDLKTVRTLVDQVPDKVAGSGPRPWEDLERKARLLSWLQDFGPSEKIYGGLFKASTTPVAVKENCRFHLAEIAAWKRDFPAALSMLDGMLASIPGRVDASLLKGQIQEWQGKYADARSTYTAGLQRHPSDAALRQRLEKLSWVK